MKTKNNKEKKADHPEKGGKADEINIDVTVSEEIEAGDSTSQEPPDEASEKLNDIQEQLDVERDKHLRLRAEYDNFRRRTKSEIGQIIARANERLILSLLPVLDDFDRFFTQKFEEVNPETILTGIEMIHRKLAGVLEAEGLEQVKTEGEIFNAELHEALAEVEDNSKPAGTIISVAEKGYMLNGSIIRHPRVILSKRTDDEQGDMQDE